MAQKPPAGAPPGDLPLAFLDSISCFETLRAYDGTFFRLEEHLRRLSESCRSIGSALPFSQAETAGWLRDVLEESGWKNAIARVSVHWEDEAAGTIAVIVRAFTAYPEEFYQRGVRLATAVPKRPVSRAQDPQIKASQFVVGVSAYLDRGKGDPYEFILLSQAGFVAEGTVSNIFIMREKRLLTPQASSGILRGVTRGAVMELAKKRGLEPSETLLTRHELYNAEECFITNTSSEVLPVVSIDGRRIGAGVPGPVTRMLAKDFKRLI